MTKLNTIVGIDQDYEDKLKSLGIKSIESLLDNGLTQSNRKKISEKTELTEKLICTWVSYADLFRIKGIGGESAEILYTAGVETVHELAHQNPRNLRDKIEEVNDVKKIIRKMPTVSQLANWVGQAKKLQRRIYY